MAHVHSFALSERGISETNNDSFCAERVGSYEVFAVASGRSGIGRKVSEIAINSLRDTVKNNTHDPAEILEKAVADADVKIGERSGHKRHHDGMGTDLCACLIDDNLDCTILDTGNGSVYYISPDSGIVFPREIPFAEKSGSLLKKVISHTLGEPIVLKGSEFHRVNLMNSFMVLSSSGFYDYVKREEIRSVVEINGENVETSCEALKNQALQAGSDRTITLIILHGHNH
jgi:serine/threonine protein phosphatase PrpC